MDPIETRRSLFPYVAVAVLLALLALRALGGGGGAEAGPSVAVDGGANAAASPGATRTGSARRRVWVHVAGAVRKPGLYRVGAGARAGEAVDAAGGLARRADLRAVNLASTVRDGQQIIVPARGEAPAAAPAGGGVVGPGGGAPGAQEAAGAKLSLASATVEQLDGLDGIGPTLAKRIVEWREAHGGFRSVEQLREVEGIGEKRFESLRAAVEP
jgi:competence protein ComEA